MVAALQRARPEGSWVNRCYVLQIGSTVEVRTNEGPSTQAVISKLTDASLYTVGQYQGVSQSRLSPLQINLLLSSEPIFPARGLCHADI